MSFKETDVLKGAGKIRHFEITLLKGFLETGDCEESKMAMIKDVIVFLFPGAGNDISNGNNETAVGC